MGYKTITQLFEMAFRTLTWLRPLDATEDHISLADQLDEIQKRLDSLEFQKQFLEKEREKHRNLNELLNFKELEAYDKIKSIEIEQIPNYQEIIVDIMDLLRDPEGVKDFVLMEQLRQYGHPESTVWLLLYKLRQLGKIKLDEGTWKRA